MRDRSTREAAPGRVSRLGIRFVQPPRRGCPIHANVGVVDAASARSEFQAADVPHAGAGHGHDEISEEVGAVGAQRVLGERDDKVGRPELPAGIRRRRRRKVGSFAFGTSVGGPPADCQNLVFGKTPLADEFHDSRFRLPRRHVPPRRHVGNLRCVTSHFVIREQTEWCRSARLVALRAVLEQNRCDVAREGDRSAVWTSGTLIGRRDEGRPRQHDAHEDGDGPFHHFGCATASSRNRRSIAPQVLDVRSASAYFRPLLPGSY
jgi:hypothetical protein